MILSEKQFNMKIKIFQLLNKFSSWGRHFLLVTMFQSLSLAIANLEKFLSKLNVKPVMVT